METNRPNSHYRAFRRDGDLDALARLFDETAPKLLALARRLGSERGEAEDWVQETFLKVLEKPEALPADGDVVPWLLGTLVNRARQERRKAARQPDPERLMQREVEAPDSGLSAAEVRAAIESAIEDLPPAQRRAVAGKLLDGRSTEDLGAELRVAPSAIRARIHRGLERLRAVLPLGLATGFLAWMLPSRGLAGVRARVLEQAARGALASGAKVTVVGTAGVMMLKKIAAAGVVGAVAWLLYTGSSGALVPEQDRPAHGLTVEPDRLVTGLPALLAPDSELAGPAMRAKSTRMGVRADMRKSQQTLVVLVRNADGRPVDNISVRVGVVEGNHPDFDSIREKTDEDGLARFAATDVERIQAQSAASLLRIELGPTIHAPVVMCLEPGVIPVDPVVLEVDMLRLIVRAVTSEGEPWTKRLGLFVQPDDYRYYSTVGSSPRIGWVPRGHGYELKVYGCGLHGDSKQHFSAPGMAEAQREHDIVLGPPMPGLTGRIVDTQGQVLPEGRRVNILDRGRTGNGSRPVIVKSEGRFEYALRLGETSGQIRLFEFTMPRGAQDHEYGAYSARVTFEVGPPGELLDLGTIVLEEQALLAAGRMTVPDGIRLKGLGISAQVLGSRRWRRHPALDNCVFISEEGEFAIYGKDTTGPDRLRVVTSFRDDVQELIPACDLSFTPGSSGLVIPLLEPGTLVARADFSVLGIGRSATFRIHVQPTGSGPMDEYLIPDGVVRATGGALTHKRVPPGKARLELLACDMGAPIASWTGIEIRAGETTDLGELVLNGNTRMLQLRLNGAAAAPLQVWYGAHGVRPLEHRARVADGVAELVAGPIPLDVLIVGAGIAPMLLESVSLDMDVELQEGVRIKVRFNGAGDLVDAFRDADPEHQLRVVFEPSELGPGGVLGAFDLLQLAKSRDFALGPALVEGFEQALPGPGVYTVRLELPRARDVLFGRATPVGLLPAAVLHSLKIEAGGDQPPLVLDLRPLLTPPSAIRFEESD